ncbi:MAG: hypothetical protein H0T89_11610 [Deltaproteobacteria bacterium]|nr:hypothetical protein [Deltaproteobacteria bacterium]
MITSGLGAAQPQPQQPPPLDGLVLADRVGAPDRAAIERAVAEIERAPATTPNLDEALRRAARACEDVLADPARALALYERILDEFPNTAASRVARARAALFRGRVGDDNAYAREAAELAQLMATADTLPPAEVERHATALATANWPGAPDAALFLPEWLQRTGRLDAAHDRYMDVVARWPESIHATAALRGAASAALDGRNWDRAVALAMRLPVGEDTDRVLRDELIERAARGRRLDRWYMVSWLGLVGALFGLFASCAEAILRGGRRWPSLRPPVEVYFLVPISAVLVGVAVTTHQAIAPAVLIVSIGGLVLAWLSGITLEHLRARRRRVGLRAVLHIALCLVAVVGLVYIVLMHDNLLEMVIETVKFGPSS